MATGVGTFALVKVAEVARADGKSLVSTRANHLSVADIIHALRLNATLVDLAKGLESVAASWFQLPERLLEVQHLKHLRQSLPIASTMRRLLDYLADPV